LDFRRLLTIRRIGAASHLCGTLFSVPRCRSILSVRDQNTFAESLRKKRLMTLVHLFLVHRFKADSVHYVTPTEDNQYQVAKMRSHGIFREVNTEVGQIIVADVDHQRISDLLAPDQEALGRLIRKER
jgi:isocitrate lyase